MFGYIILRDIPKKEAQLDLSIYEIKGGFRGFAEVPPGIHYVSVEVSGKMHEGFWCYVEPSSVVVKVYDYENDLFKDDTPESEEQYPNMALSGAMNRALIPVMQRNAKMTTEWLKLVSHIKKDHFPISLNKEIPMEPPENLSPEEMSEYYLKKHKSRFEQAFYDSHGGNKESFLSEIQFAFVRSLLRKSDNEALERWLHLLQSIYNVGERSIDTEPELFPLIIDVIITQLKILPDDWFSSESKVVNRAKYLIEDMIDTGIKNVKEKAQEFADYLKSRGISI
ncbi:MAG: AAR2 pre-mRNA splicing protein [Candidatus Hodarchaeota archaeon]